MRQRLTLLLTCSIRSRRWWRLWLALSCSRDNSPPRGFFLGMRIATWGSVNARKPRSCNSRPRRQGIRCRVRNGLIMGTAAIGVTEKEDEKQGIDEQDLFHGVVFSCRYNSLAVQPGLGGRRCAVPSRHGQKGEAGTAAGMGAIGAGSSASGTTTVATSASETPSRWARAVRSGWGIAEGA